jgi:DNA/RNA-binding domain of Phe-tRNA-synthetase-like protein
MQIKINPQILENYPDVVIGVVFVKYINNVGDDPELNALLRKVEGELENKIGNTPVTEHPNISSWRDAYRKFGAKPKKYPSSIENLVKRILKGDQVRHINKLVDAYNYISLKYLIPVGGEDLDKIKGDIVLTIASDNEAEVKLLGEPEARPPYPNEVIYKDDIGTICRRWNWKEADRTKLTEETNRAILVIEALPPVGKEQVKDAINELAQLVSKYCGAEVSTKLLSEENPQVEEN